jgi:type II secretory pathway pseudopilin PulG
MSGKTWLQLAAAGIFLVLAVSIVMAWRAERRDQAKLQEQLKSAQQAVTEANARQETRDSTLQLLIKELQKKQKAVQTPTEVMKALPEVLPLPEPLVIEAASQTAGAGKFGAQAKPNTPNPTVALPLADLKPLYDSALACKECQAELVAAQGNLKDERAKTATLGRERDDALQAAKGGSTLRRVARAAKWFLIGAAAGAVAAKVAR